jgi:hypothetical protein
MTSGTTTPTRPTDAEIIQHYQAGTLFVQCLSQIDIDSARSGSQSRVDKFLLPSALVNLDLEAPNEKRTAHLEMPRNLAIGLG